MHGLTPPTWHPDPFRRYELRYWDGAQWTHHVSTRGVQQIDPPVYASVPMTQQPAAPVPPQAPDVPAQHRLTPHPLAAPAQHHAQAVYRAPTPAPAPAARTSKKIQRQIARAGLVSDTTPGGGSLFSERVLVVNQKAKLIGHNSEYAVFDQHGRQLGAVQEVGQNRMKNAVAVRSMQQRTRKFLVFDERKSLVMSLVRPSNFMKSKMIVRWANGTEVGQISQKTLGLIGGVRFDLEILGDVVGSITGDSRNVLDLGIQDQTGREIARVTKTWSGRLFRETSREKDKYVVELFEPVEEQLRALVVATSLAIDAALRS